MKILAWVVGAVVAGTAVWLLWAELKEPQPAGYDEVHGIDFMIPEAYVVVEGGELSLAQAARRLLGALDADSLVALTFTNQGDDVQLLADVHRNVIDERTMGRHGTVRRVLWRDQVRERLEWAVRHESLEAPGAPPPERRNPYH